MSDNTRAIERIREMLKEVRLSYKIAVQCISGSVSYEDWERYDKVLGEAEALLTALGGKIDAGVR